MPPQCPECGEFTVERHEWDDGAVTEDCPCGYWDWEPPEPQMRAVSPNDSRGEPDE